MNPKGKKHRSGWRVVALDLIGLIVALNVFALFHHVLPVYIGSSQRHIVSVGAMNGQGSDAPSASPSPSGGALSAEPTPQPTYPPGDFSGRFPGYDTGWGKALSYQTDDIRVFIDQIQMDGATGYVADIWIRNISLFKTGFARGQFGKALREFPQEMSDRYSALLALSGDYYGARERGVVIRNGDLYRDSVNADTCILYADGVMEAIQKEDFDLESAVRRGAYQSWSFGPKLLFDGRAPDVFDNEIQGLNPRAAIGYYEPGHYCFVVIDGRQAGYSKGMTLKQLADLFESLGCKDAYNLDGGQSATMVFQGEVVNRPFSGGRKTSDILYIGGSAQ